MMLTSVLLYFAARQFGWNLPGYPAGEWYFNPFAWQLLFVFGAWFAVGGSLQSMPFIRSRTLLVFGVTYLMFSFVMTMAGRFPELAAMLPDWLDHAFIPNDKTNLAPYRFVHFAIVAFLVVRFVPRNWAGFERRVFRPAIVCGQQSLEVFCVGIFLSFGAHFVLVEVSHAAPMQIAVSITGIMLMTVVAFYRSWSKRMDKSPPKPTSQLPVDFQVARAG